MGQVPPVRQIHPQHGIAGLDHAGVRRLVGLRPGVRLHVGVFGVKQFLGALAGQVLEFIGKLAAGIVALAGITLGVLIGKYAAGGFENGFRSKILARDQFEMRVLPLGFLADQPENFRIHLGQGTGAALLFSRSRHSSYFRSI